MTETLEVTTLRPAAGLTTADFVAANADIDLYLQRQPGFEWRRILELADGTIIGVTRAREHRSDHRGLAADDRGPSRRVRVRWPSPRLRTTGRTSLRWAGPPGP